MTSHSQVVGDEKQRQVVFTLQASQQVENLALNGQVQRTYRLGRDEHVRIRSKRSRDPDTLTLPSRELVWVVAADGAGQAYLFQQLVRTFFLLASTETGIPHAFGDDLAQSHTRIEG